MIIYFNKVNGNQFVNVDLPFSDEGLYGEKYLSANGDWIIYVSYIESENSMKVQFYNLGNNLIFDEYMHPLPFRKGPVFNSNASIFAFIDDPTPGLPRVYVVERSNDELKKYLIEDEAINPVSLFLSSIGDQLFFGANYSENDRVVVKNGLWQPFC